MKKRTRIIIIIAIIVLIMGIIFFPKIRSLFADPVEEPAVDTAQRRSSLGVNAIILDYDTLTDVFRTKGILMPDEEVDLSFETSGKITKIYFKEGARVQQGELLATVNDETLQAELKILKTQLPLAEERVFRQQSLYEKDAVSKENFESVTTNLEKLKADIELVNARIRQTELRAPFDGVMGLRLVSEGTYASPTTIISRLTKVTPLKLEFSVNEKQVNEIRPGTKLNFTVENDPGVYQATVYAVESKLDEKTLSMKVRALYPNTNGRLKPGHSATIEIQLQEILNTIVIPSISTIVEMGNSMAYVYKNGVARQVDVTKGMRTASSVQILDGLNAGDTLLVSGVMQLRDGMPVNINLLQK